MRKSVWWLSSMVVLAGCEIIPNEPVRVTLPPLVGPLLNTSGIPVGRLNTLVLSKVSDQPNGTVEFWQEWQHAPAMTAVSLGRDVVANVDDDLRSMVPGLSPLERDFAICKKVTVNGEEQPLPTAANYAPLDLGDGTSVLRVKGSLTGVSIVPDAHSASSPAFATMMLADGTRESASFDISVSAANLAVVIVWNGTEYTTTVGNVSMSCKATIADAQGVVARQCGEKLVRCAANTSVSISGFMSDIPLVLTLWPSAAPRINDAIVGLLSRGMVLHFDNFFSGALTFTDSGSGPWLHMQGSSTVINNHSMCSPVLPPPPPQPPTRELLNVNAYVGHGEDVSQNGYVRKFDLFPVVGSDVLDTADHRNLLMEKQLLLPAEKGFHTFGKEGVPYEQFMVGKVETYARLRKEYPSSCWVKPTLFADFIRDDWQVATMLGDQMIARLSDDMAKQSLTMQSIEDASPEEVAAALKALKRDCGACQGWSRVRGFALPKDATEYPIADPFDGSGRPLPWDVSIFVPEVPERLVELFGPQLRCADASGKLDPEAEKAYKVGEVVHANPMIAMYGVMFDSSVVGSSAYSNQLLKGSRWNFAYGTRTETAIAMTSACTFPNGSDESIECWRGQIAAPARGQVKVVDAWSGTANPRMSVRSAVQNSAIPALGDRTAAVQGNFDRSAVDVFTAVPSDYVRAGISQGGFDFRGTVQLDWGHDNSDFNEPNGVAHVDANRGDWLDRDTGVGGTWGSFFADWSRDSITLRRRQAETFSYCTLPADLTIGVKRLSFSAGGLSSNRTVDASALFSVSGQPSSAVVRANNSIAAPTAPVMAP